MIDTRYALPVIMLFILAAVPTVIHGYRGLVVEDGYRASAIPMTLAQASGTPVSRPSPWILDTYGSSDWLERDYRFPDGKVVRLFVARSHDAKKLYHHPELGVFHGRALEWAGRERFDTRPEMPVTILRGEQRGPGVVFYALLTDGEFMDNPYLHQVRMSLSMLTNGRRATTLFMAADLNHPPHAPAQASRALEVLNAAVDNFLAQEPNP